MIAPLYLPFHTPKPCSDVMNMVHVTCQQQTCSIGTHCMCGMYHLCTTAFIVVGCTLFLLACCSVNRELMAICSRARNAYSKARLKEDFKEGIQAVRTALGRGRMCGQERQQDGT